MAYKQTFVRYISHEVRSPLSTTSLGLDFLIDILQAAHAAGAGGELNREELLELAQDCKTTCDTAIQTLSDLLLYDKIESKMLQLELHAVAGHTLLETCLKPLEKHIKLSGIHSVVLLDDMVAHTEMIVDKLKIEQVMRNFVSNAVKFTPTGGQITMQAKVYLVPASGSGSALGQAQQQQQPRLRFGITDTGPGIELVRPPSSPLQPAP
jgi:signal transduction histidine kinase